MKRNTNYRRFKTKMIQQEYVKLLAKEDANVDPVIY